jgi:hypothetical protein
MARPSSYKPSFNKTAEKLCMLGLTDVQIANVFEVSEVTLNSWKKKFPLFLKSLKRGKAIADGQVVESLFKRATGYSHPDSQIFYNSKTKEVIVEKTVKHYAPDTTAAIFWLKNRQPEKWRDKHEVDTNIKQDIDFTLDID